MDILACLQKLLPGWQGAVWGNSYEGIAPHELETRPIPTLAELEAVWPEVQVEIIVTQKRQAYKSEADPLYIEWQILLAVNHPDAATRHQEWLDKRSEIDLRFIKET
jgi:hypothetical protein